MLSKPINSTQLSFLQPGLCVGTLAYHYRAEYARRKGFSRRAAIEPKIGHLKADHHLSRNFYKEIKGDDINVMLAAAAMNFKRMMNIWKKQIW